MIQKQVEPGYQIHSGHIDSSYHQKEDCVNFEDLGCNIVYIWENANVRSVLRTMRNKGFENFSLVVIFFFLFQILELQACLSSEPGTVAVGVSLLIYEERHDNKATFLQFLVEAFISYKCPEGCGSLVAVCWVGRGQTLSSCPAAHLSSYYLNVPNRSILFMYSGSLPVFKIGLERCLSQR